VVKTSPSGGARHPIEVYPVVLAIENIEPGIYHYSVRENSIAALRTGGVADLAVELCAGHEWIRTAAAVFFMTAVVERSAWKYPSSHAYRVLHLDAGHLGQTFHLVCTELGLGPFTFAATYNPAVEAALGIDGVTEIVMYTAAVGVPAPGAAGPTGASPTTASDGRPTVT
jgi:SagB-type dehydrogenase family enzyme